MKLDEYLERVGKSRTEFAIEIDATPQTVERYVNGKRIPEPEFMERIYEVTGGKVSANDFYGLKDIPAS